LSIARRWAKLGGMKFLLALVAVLAACSAVQMNGDTLRSRASFDLRCPANELQITEIDRHTGGVDGCGQRATYIWNGPSNTWILNSPGSEQAMPPEAPPPPPTTPPPPPPPPPAPPH
jgi:hypothetical protein